MSKDWPRLNKVQIGVVAAVGCVLLAIGVGVLDNTAYGNLLGLVLGLVGMGLLAFAVLRLF